jgi:hypothetical protein
MSVLIQVSGAGGAAIGFLGLDGAQDRYIVVSALEADLFTFSASVTGISSQLAILDTDAPASSFFLAGLISPGVELKTSNSK